MINTLCLFPGKHELLLAGAPPCGAPSPVCGGSGTSFCTSQVAQLCATRSACRRVSPSSPPADRPEV